MKYSAFNQINNNQLAEPMFFGNPVNISRFDQQKHEMFERLTEKQLSFFWRPEEIDISKDRIDFNGLSDSEKHIFLSNLKYQCLVEETEVLTPEGWVFIRNLKKGQLVYIYNPITKLGYFEEPRAIIHKPHNGIVYNFKSKGKLKYRQMVTPDHRMYYHDTMDKSEFGVMNAEDLTFIENIQTGIIGYPYPNVIESVIIGPSVSLFLLIDFLITQSIPVVKEINHVNTTITLPFTGLNKETKIELLQFLNDYTSQMNEIYKEDIYSSSIDENQFTMKLDNKYFADLISDKPFGFIDSKEISDYLCVQIVVYLMEFNSSLFNKKEGKFYFEDESIVDLVQALAVRGGFATKSKLNKLKIVDATHTEDSLIVKTKEVYHGFVSCVSVSTNAFFIRYKGVTSVTGNCVLDSIQGRSPNVVLLPLASIPELETWIELWSAFEGAIHARSYTHIIRGIVDNPEVVFDDIMVNPNILKRAEGSSKYYDDLLEYTCLYNLAGWGVHTLNGKVYDINPKSMKKKLYLCLVSINVLEAIRFYVSFA